MNTLPAQNDSARNDSMRNGNFRLGPWLVQPARHRLVSINSDTERSLEPRLMHLLCLLATADGGVLSRDTLLNAVWPRVVVTENSLSRAISDLRRQLRHPEHRLDYIETIPKGGYRLAVPVNKTALTGSRTNRSRLTLSWHRWAMAAGLSAIVAGVAGWMVTSGQQEHTRTIAQLPSGFADIQLSDRKDTGTARYESTLALQQDTPDPISGTAASRSPDGELFAFVRYEDEGSSLMIGATGSDQMPLTVYSTDEFIHHVQWSPVGSAVLFAVSARLNPASLLHRNSAGRLLLFDLNTLTLTELLRQDHERAPVVNDDSGNLT